MNKAVQSLPQHRIYESNSIEKFLPKGFPIVDKCTQIFDEHELVSTNKLHHLNAQLWLAATDHVMPPCPVIGQWSSDTNYELCPADRVMIFN